MTAAAAANSPPVVLAVGNMRRFLFVNRWVKMLIERGALELAGAVGTVELSRTRTLRNTAVVTGSRGRVKVALHGNEVVGVSPGELAAWELDGRSGAAMPDEDLWGDMFERELRDWLAAIRSAGAPFVAGASAAPGIDVIDQCRRMRRPLRSPWAETPRGGAAPRGGLRGRTVLVTGASGFIGGRLTERLVLEEGARASGRRFARSRTPRGYPASRPRRSRCGAST